ncbi:similar to Saccharomyces cerevisiae YHR211W FLO5 Lectin-like cell wall protein (flocculin) involved in flocculation [Maudiozyma saulgeensis]|uniref:Similar to Saccharomyces cerevisiae YHR211W FLO5 Lectin-like cell wall protein (Flocculin) involved in flocculation n=1 Tax=Maudiozyma saulgeensis TaxID=1789683 RepID=A0A1X7QX62_9SACH|nr:similar to Saccharomyces cerevisiae YHR211W FLO5 Lectin-like cell wall protein (flocculin) involved in flocculation [Kazachstania saulgeensis]
MKMQFKYPLITSVVALFGKVATAGSETDTCFATLGSSIDGLQARFFKYVYPDYAREYSDKDYVTFGYDRDDRYITTLTGVTDVNFFHFFNINQNGPTWGEINGLNITTSNFTVEYSGWFTPIETGDHIFTIGQTDDATRIEIMGDSSSYCCNNTDINSTVVESYQIYNNPTVHEQNVYLQSGVSYPLKIVYFNKDSVGIQTINFTDPSGTVHDTFDGYVKYYTDVVCDKTPAQTSTSELPESSTTLASVIVSSDPESVSHSTKTLTPCDSSSTTSSHPCKTTTSRPQKCPCRKPWVHTRHGGWTHERPHHHC